MSTKRKQPDYSIDAWTVQHHTDRLKDEGFFAMANLPLAKKYVVALKREFPNIQLVHGVSSFGVGQYIFLPKLRRHLASIVRLRLANATRDRRAYAKALKKLQKPL